jgi:protein O-mannosyl-transferase
MSPTLTRNTHRHPLILYLVPALCALALYWPSLSFDFVYDDDYFVVRNLAVHSWRHLPRYFVDVETYSVDLHAPMYRPLRNISYLVDWSIAGRRPAWFHAHNILLHAANACLVLWVLRLLAGFARAPKDTAVQPPAAALPCLAGVLLWLAHPVHTEAVGWIKSRDELLFALFYLGAVGMWLSAIRLKSFGPVRTAWIVALCIFSLFSKEMAISLPLVLLAAGVYFADRKDLPKVLRVPALALVATVGFVAVRHLVIGKTQQQAFLAGNWYAQMLTMTRVAMRYVGLAVAPSGLTINYDDFGISRSMSDWRVIVSLLGVAAILGTIWRTRRRHPVISFGILWFGLTLLPVSNVIPTMQWMAERFLYLPLVGLAACVAAGLTSLQLRLVAETDEGRIAPRDARRRAIAVAVLMAGLFAALTAATCLRLPVWRNDMALHERTYLDSTPSPRIVRNYAVALANRGRYESAVPLFRDLLAESEKTQGQVDTATVEQGLGLALMLTGHVDEGLSHSLRALALRPNDVETLRHVTFGFRVSKDYATALRFCEKALQQAPDDAKLAAERDGILTALASQQASTTTAQPLSGASSR